MWFRTAFVALLTTTAFAAEPRNAPDDTRSLIADTCRSSLIRELTGKDGSPKEFVGPMEKGTIKAKVGPLDITIGVTAQMTLTVPNASQKVTVKFDQLKRVSKDRIAAQLQVSGPVKGKVTGEIGPLKPTIGVEADATIDLSVDLKIVEDKEKGETRIEPTITKWNGSVKNLTFKDEFADRNFGSAATKAVNDALSQGNEKLKDAANKAIADAVAEGRCKVKLEELSP